MASFGWGLQRVMDAQQRLTRDSAGPVYLRLRNFTNQQNQAFDQLGFAITPTGTAQTGFIDIKIDPPPSVNEISIHNIGQSNGKLMFGAKRFFISGSFVAAMMTAQGLAKQDLVWRGPNVVGLVYEGILYSIENVVSKEIAGITVLYRLDCNGNELR
jgi:hypothetical protein